MRVLIAGCGYVGSALGERLAAAGHDVTGTRRRPPGDGGAFSWSAADVLRPDTLAALPAGFDAAVYAVSAGGYSDESYRDAYVTGVRNVLEALRASSPALRRFVFVSSTGVYHQNDGETVDEASPALPARFSGTRLLEGEAAALDSGLPACVVRFSGIYGPGRDRTIESVRSGTARLTREPAVLNYVHRDDCAGVLAHVLQLENPAPLYLGTDSEPVQKNDTLRWIAQQLGLPEPPLADEAQSPPARGGHRFYNNNRLLDTGYAFTYPTYREGYGSLL